MAKRVLLDVKTTINGQDFSDHLAAVTWSISSDEIETTAFGTGWRSRIAGLKDATVTLSFHQDFATTGSGAVDQTVWNNFGSLATVVCTPLSSAVSPSNPSYSGVFLVSQTAFGGNVGDLDTLEVTWPLASGSGVTRGTA